MERIPFDDLPTHVALLSREIAELKAKVAEKLTTPDGYEPDVTMDAQQVAEYLHCTVDNVYKKARTGKLPHHRSGKLIFFKKKDVDEATRVNNYKRKFFK